MTRKGIWLFILLSLVLAFPSLLVSSGNYKILNGPKDFYFGHISLVEIKNDGKDPQVWREGKTTPEIADLNVPLGPGDTIRTSDARRCEIQFDNGTIVRLDLDTELKIETIMAQALSSWNKMSNLVLSRGGIYLMYKKYNSREVFQVITMNAAIKLTHKTVAMVSLNDNGMDIQVKYGRAYVLFGPDAGHLQDVEVKKLERVTVYKDHQFARLAYLQDTDFEAWNKSINESFNELHEGKNFLPKPILRYPEAVVNFALKYSMYGEWLWHDLYGYVWRPYMDQYYPWNLWMPYVYGRWTEINGELFWIPRERWGWVPSHLGYWVWDKNKGWLWIPGSVFAPSYAGFYYYYGYYAWHPWTPWPWDLYLLYIHYFGDWPRYWNFYLPYVSLVFPGAYPSAGYWDKPLQTISINQLKKSPKVHLPKELERLRHEILNALKRGDTRILASLEAMPRMLVLVRDKDLNARGIQERVVRLEQLAKRGEIPFSPRQNRLLLTSQNAYEGAVRTFIRNNIVSELREYVVSSYKQRSEPTRPISYQRSIPESIKSLLPAPALRFRDWNPDIRVARDLGVSITYSSRNNEVRCPQLNISSRDVSWPGRWSSSHGEGRFASSGSSGHSSSGSSSGGSSSSSGSSGAHHSGASTGHSSRGAEKN